MHSYKTSDLLTPTNTAGSAAVLFHRDAATEKVHVYPVYCDDLENPDWSTTPISEQYLRTESGRQLWKATAPSSDANGFFSLRATEEW